MTDARQRQLAHILLFIMICGFAVITFGTALSYHHELKSQGADTGVILQILKNLITHGKFVTTLTVPHIEQHWFGVHFSPVLFLLTPLALWFDGFYFLNAVSAISFSLAAIPIYLSCRELKLPPLQAAGWSGVFLINPFVINAAVIDFHEICFAAPILAFTVLYLLKKDTRRMIVCLLILLTVKEHYAFAFVGFGMAWFFLYGDKKTALWLGIFGCLFMAVDLLVIIRYFSEGRENIFFAKGKQSSGFGWLLNVIHDPQTLLIAIINSFLYLFILMLPFLFLPLGSIPIMFTAIADFSSNSLFASGYIRSFSAYYSAALIPTLVIASAYASVRFSQKRGKLTTRDLLACVLFISIPYSISHGNLPFRYFQNGYQLGSWAAPMAPENHDSINEIKELLKSDHVISTASHIAPWFATQRKIYTFPMQLDNVDTIILYTQKVYQDPHDIPIPLFSVSSSDYFNALEQLLSNPNWHVAYFKNHWVLLKKTGATKADDSLKKEVIKAIEMQKTYFEEKPPLAKH